MQDRIVAPQTQRGEGIRQIGVDLYKVESFENPGMFYQTDLSTKTCTCPASRFGYGCQKHLVLADAVDSVPDGPGASVVIARLIDLCRGIYSSTGPLMSTRILTEVLYYRWSTTAMRAAAVQRHSRNAA